MRPARIFPNKSAQRHGAVARSSAARPRDCEYLMFTRAKNFEGLALHELALASELSKRELQHGDVTSVIAITG